MIKRNVTSFLCLFLPFWAIAQLNTAPEPTLENPYNTMYVHLHFLQPQTYDPAIAAKTFPPNVDSITAEDLAIRLKQVLDGKGLFVRLNQLPQEQNYRDTVSRKPYYTPFPERLPEVYLEKIENKWYYSRETSDLIPGLHKNLYPLGSDVILKILPQNATSSFLGLALWQYLGILLIIVALFILYLLVSRLVRPLIKLITSKRVTLNFMSAETVWKLTRYLSLIFIIWVGKILLPTLQLPIRISEFANKSTDIILTVFMILLGLLIIDIFTQRARDLAAKTESKMDDQVLPIIKRTLKILAVILGVFYILKLLDVNITALIAGISIGGLALALAAQDSVKNLIGSMMIFIDKPFQVGDYIMGSGFEGEVVEVGFRSTRIKKVDTAIISVPNGNMANMSITNLGVRVFRIFNIKLGLTYGTSPDKIEEFIEALKQLVIDHPKITTEIYYVHFQELADFSLNIMFRCYLVVGGFAEELAVKEEVLLRILRIAEKVGVDFAFPSQTLYVEKS